MRKAFAFSLILLFLAACQKRINAADINKINGYWEIEKVVFADGSEKDFNSSTVYDYFSIHDGNGVRKKVTPQLDGSFEVDNCNEKVSIMNHNENYILKYTTHYATWEENLISVSDRELITSNKSKKEYYYKRAFPINIIPHGTKTK